MRKLWNRLLWFLVLASFVVASVVAGYELSGINDGKGMLSYILSGVPVITVFSAGSLYLVYLLLVRVNRALQPIHIKNQIKALIELSNAPDWDANDMGRRLSQLVALNRANGKELVRGVVLAGFSTRVLEETAYKEEDEVFRDLVLSVRAKNDSHFLKLMLIVPWVSLLAFVHAPTFFKAFSSWTWHWQGLFIGSILVMYGMVPFKLLFEWMKPK